MQIFSNNELNLEASVISIGAFDGVHCGHQALIKNAVQRARVLGYPSVVYTFNPPPRVHFQGSMELIELGSKIQVMKQLGIDYLIIADFNDQYASRPAEEFMGELDSLGAKEIWVGENFQFGKDKQGTVHTLASRFPIKLHPLVTCEKGEVISSTRIRNLLLKNEHKEACLLLGEPK